MKIALPNENLVECWLFSYRTRI